ncbi:hypothetical protein SZ50_12780 [Brachyspira hyodysenteriae]|nr:hypothetical protein SU46_08295 [Brachyspira hyodysenteriae]KLI18130.1 hypothetical protein SU44_02585 [Brachyspira hyodysenteriae]KLI24060.1 hypothetical protein SU43_05495 [Brachyspira hyodysenteriae]KLI28111.1 hypothetical protein SR30_00250 [Brachyspira hyodysenteriae]KLI30196.1 hypothetical protein SZ50_12780 [Brachyspira hyodysenteriae]
MLKLLKSIIYKQEFFKQLKKEDGLTYKKYYGTGSYIFFARGLHLSTLAIARKLPFIAPYLMTACLAYSEHEGIYLQEGLK